MNQTSTLSTWDAIKLAFLRAIGSFFSLFYSQPGTGQVVQTIEKSSTSEINNTGESGYYEVPRPMAPLVVEVTAEERKAIIDTAVQLQARYGKYDNPAFTGMIHIHAYRLLPERILKMLSDLAADFSYQQFGAIVFRGLIDVDQDALGPTPDTWRETDLSKIKLYGFVSALIHGAARAVPIQQYYQRKGGGLLHSVIPNTQMADTQTGEGSATQLYVHTEDACLTSAADYLSFLYLRNEEEAPSMLHSVRSHDLCKPYVDILYKPIFKCPLDGNYSSSDKAGKEKSAPVLFGNDTLPFMRFDPAEQLSSSANQTPEAFDALSAFWSDAEKLIFKGYVPSSGDLVFVNNKMVSHGRSAFVAGFKKVDGILVPCEKRWMLRMMSTANLMAFYRYAHPENPYLGWEKQYDILFNNENN